VRPAAPSYRCQADLALGDGFGLATASILVLTLAFTGAIVGVVHGLALVWLGRTGRRL
jgi:NhaP-type Na+/H+ or K+/H+ antiporter